jgi:catechol 2,3-dioxygenase-like lactoylglutathione lyase family enzyme
MSLATDFHRRPSTRHPTHDHSKESSVTETSTDSNIWAKAIQAITLVVDDLDQAKDFYHRVFELPVVFEDPTSCAFAFVGTVVNLLSASAAPELIDPAPVAAAEAGSRVVFTIEVADVDAVCARLAERGVELLNGPMDRPWGIRTASFRDPGGHIWEIAA